MKAKIAIIGLAVFETILLFFLFFGDVNFQLINVKGDIARKQRDLFLISTFLMLLIIVPVVASIFIVANRYRENNKNVIREGKIKSNKFLLASFWTGPIIIIFTIALLTFRATHALDPSKPIESNIDPVKIQVVSLQWRWLFIYPEEGIATINYIQFPEDTPVDFELTSDAPMNSFWIPSLGGQIYTMTGMSNKLSLIANDKGDYPGSSAEISGIGYSKMTFVARASSFEDYRKWIEDVKSNQNHLTFEEYQVLSQPSKDSAQTFYSSVEDNLYYKIIDKYMTMKEAKNGHN